MSKGKIIEFYISADQVEKWMHQNKACYSGAFVDGVLLDNFGIDTEKGFAFFYEHAVNEWTSNYRVEYAISKEKNEDGKYKHCEEWKTVWNNWYDFEERGGGKQMTITQKKRLLKVKSDIESMFEGNLARFKFTPYMVELVLDVYGNLVNEQTAETICAEVKDFFAKRNFTVKEKEIGWEISL